VNRRSHICWLGFPIALLALAWVWIPGSAFAEDPGVQAYFKNRSPEELLALERGDILVGKLSDWRKMGLGASGQAADRLRERIAALRPNYVTEFMAVTQADDGALDRLAAALGDVKDYVTIVYHSKRYDHDFPLFDKMTVRSRKALPGGERIESSQHMMPFEDFDAGYEYSLSGDELYFDSQNSSSLRYGGFSAVKPGDMVWSIYALRSGGSVYFYGIGAMSAFDAFGIVRDRLETSFIGRVESFMRYMYGRMKG
jgi:hypothetical protein